MLHCKIQSSSIKFIIINMSSLGNYKDRYIYDSDKPMTSEDNIFTFKAFDALTRINVLLIELRLVYKDSAEYTIKKNELQSMTTLLEKAKQIQHHNITKIYEVLKVDNKTIAVLEFCQNGSLITYLKKEKFIQERLALYITKQILLGLKQLHKKGIAHGYINLENLQVDAKGVWKLSWKCLILKAFYLSPEFKLERIKQSGGDIFSLGTAFYKMMFGVFPYTGKSNEEIIENVKKGERRTESIINQLLPFQIFISKQTQNLVFRMLNFNSGFRPAAESIINEITTLLRQDIIKIKSNQEIENDYILSGLMDKIDHQGYYSEIVWTAIHKKTNELVKIKNIELSITKEDSQTIQQYKKKLIFFKNTLPSDTLRNSFIQIREFFLTNNTLTIIYQYFNQNTLFDYFNKRRNMKEIQYLQEPEVEEIGFYLSAAAKFYTQSFQMHTWLTNKHIYLKQGRLKICEPPLELQSLRKKLTELKDNVDFLSPQKKKNKINKLLGNKTDIWSIGANIYKLLFNSLPLFDSNNSLIFPFKRTISIQLKKKLSLCLAVDQKQRKQIQFASPGVDRMAKFYQTTSVQAKQLNQTISRNDFKSIRKNTRLFNQTQDNQFLGTPKQPSVKSKDLPIIIKTKQIKKTNKLEEIQEDSADQDWLEHVCIGLGECLTLSMIQKTGYFQVLNTHWTKKVRYGIKATICIVAYMFLFYYLYVYTAANLIINSNFYLAQTITMRKASTDTIPNINFTVVTTNPSYFTSYYNQTLDSVKINMDCVRNNYYNPGIYGNQVYVQQVIQSAGFQAFEIFGFIFILIHLILKVCQICKLDLPKLMYVLKKPQVSKYNKILSYIFLYLAFSSLTSIHYLIYGSLYHMSLQPCLVNPPLPAVQSLFSGWTGSFVLTYIWQYIGLLIAYIVIIYMAFFLKNNQLQNYVWITLLLLYITGAGTRGIGGYVSNKGSYQGWVSLCGICGQILQICLFFICGLVDYVFWKGMKKKAAQKQKEIHFTNESNNSINNTEL